MKKYNLLVVAHPDDETIFFGGLLQVYRRRPWRLLCVTDGNADGLGKTRAGYFADACKAYNVKDFEIWDFPDRFESRLDLARLTERLAKEAPSEVFTHGILGEYGHPHHQDVCLAVHRAFKPTKLPVWSVAYNCFGEKTFRLPRKAYEKKCNLLAHLYHQQTQHFARWLPAQNYEGFVQVPLHEIEALHGFFAEEKHLKPDDLSIYRWFEPYLETYREQIHSRPF
jgi:LmbE family N-acetylglucosaminyl deacetylase